jgi:predicted PurR-regulated permease PerM
VPNIGSFIAAVPPVTLALLQFGIGRALLAAAGYIVMETVVGNLLEPRWMGRGLGISPLVVFISLIFWGWVLGPVGMLFSVPLTMIVKIVLDNSDDFRWVAVLLGSDVPKAAPAKRK